MKEPLSLQFVCVTDECRERLQITDIEQHMEEHHMETAPEVVPLSIYEQHKKAS